MLDHLESVLANEPVAVKIGQFIVEVKPQFYACHEMKSQGIEETRLQLMDVLAGRKTGGYTDGSIIISVIDLFSLVALSPAVKKETRKKMVVEPTKEHVHVANTEPVASSTDNVEKTKKKIKKGVFSMKWNSLFRSKKDDFEKRLQHIFKEEAVVIARINKRYQNWRRMTRHLIVLSVLLEVMY
ncbi:hypothetical protein KY285_020654 [Solanum tuberosum]|nr:hypothetical protein KY285_020654 [Solanum tuberosum]